MTGIDRVVADVLPLGSDAHGTEVAMERAGVGLANGTLTAVVRSRQPLTRGSSWSAPLPWHLSLAVRPRCPQRDSPRRSGDDFHSARCFIRRGRGMAGPTTHTFQIRRYPIGPDRRVSSKVPFRPAGRQCWPTRGRYGHGRRSRPLSRPPDPADRRCRSPGSTFPRHSPTRRNQGGPGSGSFAYAVTVSMQGLPGNGTQADAPWKATMTVGAALAGTGGSGTCGAGAVGEWLQAPHVARIRAEQAARKPLSGRGVPTAVAVGWSRIVMRFPFTSAATNAARIGGRGVRKATPQVEGCQPSASVPAP